jgi:hypothetical protein
MKIFRVSLVLATLTALVQPAWGATTWNAGSVDSGRTAFNQYCFNVCHSEAANAPKFVPARFNPDYLLFAFASVPAMAPNNSLPRQTINDLATYFGFVGLGLPDRNDTDRLLDWAEDTYPQLLSPSRQTTQQLAGYSYRYYSTTGIYLATKDSGVWYVNSRAPGAAIQPLGPLRGFLDQMPNGR